MEFLQKIICRKNEIIFEPEKWCKKLGIKCEKCNVSLTHQKCLSLCRCYYFCHRSCFISSFQTQLIDQQVDYRCAQCRQILNIKLEAKYKYSPSKSWARIIKIGVTVTLLTITVLGIVLTLNGALKPDLSFFLVYLQGLMLSLLLYLLVAYVRDLLYVKEVKIKEIISTRLEIQTSAFQDLDIQTNQELTKDELIFDSRKEKG